MGPRKKRPRAKRIVRRADTAPPHCYLFSAVLFGTERNCAVAGATIDRPVAASTAHVVGHRFRRQFALFRLSKAHHNEFYPERRLSESEHPQRQLERDATPDLYRLQQPSGDCSGNRLTSRFHRKHAAVLSPHSTGVCIFGDGPFPIADEDIAHFPTRRHHCTRQRANMQKQRAADDSFFAKPG